VFRPSTWKRGVPCLLNNVKQIRVIGGINPKVFGILGKLLLIKLFFYFLLRFFGI